MNTIDATAATPEVTAIDATAPEANINAIPAAPPKPFVISSTAINLSAVDPYICPMCGGKKATRESLVCLRCYRTKGQSVAEREALHSAVQTAKTAFAGEIVAGLGNVDRSTLARVWTSLVLHKKAEVIRPREGAKFTTPFRTMVYSVKGGRVELFVFAQNVEALQPGKRYAGVLSVRTRQMLSPEKEPLLNEAGQPKLVHYLRFEVAENVAADTELSVTETEVGRDKFVPELPQFHFTETFASGKARDCHIGFVPLK